MIKILGKEDQTCRQFRQRISKIWEIYAKRIKHVDNLGKEYQRYGQFMQRGSNM
jgi:hypothetical protein